MMIDESQLQNLGAEVAVGDIDAELSRLFAGPRSDDNDSDNGSPGERSGIARASLLNLAVYAEEPRLAAGLSAIIEELTRETACRAILILARAGGAPSVRCWVRAHCRLSDHGQKTICSEQVSFLLGGADASLVRNTVFAHLDSDLPLVFWWRGELSDVFEERLYSRVDRFLFDSASWARPATQFLRLSAALQESDTAFAAHDLAYTRCLPVRTAIARIFDDPAARHALDRLTQLEIVHAPGHRVSALWMAAWIADRLDGQLDAQASTAGSFRFQGSPAPSAFIIACREAEAERNSGDDGEALQSVKIDLGAAGEIRIRHQSESNLWRVTRCLTDTPADEKLFPGCASADADLVSVILVRAGRNRAMAEALPLLRQLMAL